MPGVAQCSAICAPMVPAPSTVTELIPICVICAFHLRAPRYGGQVCGSPALHSVDKEIDDRVRFSVEVVLAAAQHPVDGHLAERPKKDLRRGGRADVLAECAALLAVGDRLANQLEVVLRER